MVRRRVEEKAIIAEAPRANSFCWCHSPVKRECGHSARDAGAFVDILPGQSPPAQFLVVITHWNHTACKVVYDTQWPRQNAPAKQIMPSRSLMAKSMGNVVGSGVLATHLHAGRMHHHYQPHHEISKGISSGNSSVAAQAPQGGLRGFRIVRPRLSRC